MEAQLILFIILTILTVNFMIERVLDYLNRQNKKHDLPEELKGVYDEARYQRSLEYQQANDRFGAITATFGFVVSVVLLLSGLFGWLDDQLRSWIEYPVTLSLVYFGVLFIASDLINLPFQLYHTFVIEEKFGFNKMTPRLFFQDKLKGYALTALLGGLIIGTFLYLVMELGEQFWLYFWGVATVIMVLLNIFYTSIFVPMFNKLTPLEEGGLKEAITSYAQKVSFPITNVYVIDGSKRSSKSNAFFSGLGSKKKVVLYDTLIEQHSTEELVAIIAHEVGHYKKKHIISGLLMSVFQVGFTLYVLSLLLFNEELSFALGGQQLSIHLNLIAFGILYSPISTLTGLLMNVISRKNEFEADAYATHTYGGGPLQTALKKLSAHNMSNLLPHNWYVFFHYSHPPLLERLRAIRRETVLSRS
uniref:M48 family metallopeptidase n=1 Tax=Roseihalotalea indica TaxID=2867963 RepID=A0AA49GUF5_9BACT|nr:M48 family metallopeptidase [Tunicatimonas sp. TK19036]